MQQGNAAGQGADGAAAAYLSDEEILGLEPEGAGESAASNATRQASSAVIPTPTRSGEESLLHAGEQRDSSVGPTPSAVPRNDNASATDAAQPPEWLAAALADPRHAGEARALWDAHQAYRAIFPDVADARALKELLPGGAAEARELRTVAESLDRLDGAYYSNDARAQGELAAALYDDDPAVFRAMFAEAARLLAARDPEALQNVARLFRGGEVAPEPGAGQPGATPPQSNDPGYKDQAQSVSAAPQQAEFRATQYAAFEQAANQAVAADLRGAIDRALAAALPENVAPGAARRISDDIFLEVHQTLAADRGLTQQVSEILRGWRFDDAAQRQVVQLITARARAVVPAVARRVIGEWTSSVLSSAREKQARQERAVQRVDIAGGGGLEPVPARPVRPGDIDYATTSDDQILSW